MKSKIKTEKNVIDFWQAALAFLSRFRFFLVRVLFYIVLFFRRLMLRLRHCLPGPSAIRVLSSAVASGSDKAGAETSEGGSSSSSQQGGRLPRITIQPAIKVVV